VLGLAQRRAIDLLADHGATRNGSRSFTMESLQLEEYKPGR
jgi:hypothetical protein